MITTLSAITKDQLFKGAIVTHEDDDRYIAVVQSVRRDEITVVDIYGWHETSTSHCSLRPCGITHYTLRRLGFEETEPMSTRYTLPNKVEGYTLSVRRRRRSWLLRINESNIHVASVHQLQLVIWSMTGLMLEPAPELDDDEWDWTQMLFQNNN